MDNNTAQKSFFWFDGQWFYSQESLDKYIEQTV